MTRALFDSITQDDCRRAGRLFARLNKAPAFGDRAHEPVWHAVMSQSSKCVELMVVKNLGKTAARIILSKPNRQGGTVLHAASFTGDKAMARALLRAGASPSQPDQDGFTPLHAALEGWNRLVQHRHGAPPPTARAPLHNEVIKLLVEHGAEVDKADNNDRTPLQQAVG